MKFILSTVETWQITADKIAAKYGLKFEKDFGGLLSIIIPSNPLPFPFLSKSRCAITFDNRSTNKIIVRFI